MLSAVPNVPPRRGENGSGYPTGQPRVSKFEPREGLPEPESLAENEHWRKHPSDYHADCAVDAMMRAHNEADTLRRGQDLKVAEIHAQLSMRDALLEAVATLKDLAAQHFTPESRDE